MRIDKYKIYELGEYSYKNFVLLSPDEIKIVWEWRNNEDVRKWMFTKKIIPFENHCRFVNSLRDRVDRYYWLVYRNKEAFGVLSIVKYDEDKNEGEPGYYLSPFIANSGAGIEFQYNYKSFFFNLLGINNLYGHLLWGNTNAYLLSKFFGAKDDGVIEEDGRKYIEAHTTSEDFIKITPEKLASKFVKFIKNNPIDWENYEIQK